jgi:hypothetical protein
MDLDLIVTEIKDFENKQYLCLQDENKHTLFLTTDTLPLTSDQIQIENGTITLKIQKSMSDKLFDQINAIEAALIKCMFNLKSVVETNLPFCCQQAMYQTSKSDYNKILRPNYYQGCDPTIYLKGNFANLKLLSWTGITGNLCM